MHLAILTLTLRKSIQMYKIHSEKLFLLIFEVFILNIEPFTSIFNVIMPKFNVLLLPETYGLCQSSL